MVPDSARLAFLSDCAKSGQLELYVTGSQPAAPRASSPALPGIWRIRAGRPTEIDRVLFTENAPRMAGPLEPETPDQGVVEQKVFEQRIAIVDPATGVARQVSPADLYIYEYDWSPDGKTFAATAAHGVGDNNWWIADLYTISRRRKRCEADLPSRRAAADRESALVARRQVDRLHRRPDERRGRHRRRNLRRVRRRRVGWSVRNLTPGIPRSVESIAWPRAGPHRVRRDPRRRRRHLAARSR